MEVYRQYDVIVRVDYSYENEQGDVRHAFMSNCGLATTSHETIEELVEWCAQQGRFNPGEPIKRVLHSEVTLYTVNEVVQDV